MIAPGAFAHSSPHGLRLSPCGAVIGVPILQPDTVAADHSRLALQLHDHIDDLAGIGLDGGPAHIDAAQQGEHGDLVDRATGATSVSKLFSGGDCIRGGGEIVDAVEDGKIAAGEIKKQLAGEPPALAGGEASVGVPLTPGLTPAVRQRMLARERRDADPPIRSRSTAPKCL